MMSGKTPNWLLKMMPSMLADYQSGLTSIEVGRKYGVSCDTVMRHAHKAGIARSKSQVKLATLNPNWNKSVLTYAGLHARVRRQLPKPAKCQDCNQAAPRDLANISQAYKLDLSDWEWLCRHCHMTKDGRMDNLIQGFNPNGYKLKTHCVHGHKYTQENTYVWSNVRRCRACEHIRTKKRWANR